MNKDRLLSKEVLVNTNVKNLWNDWTTQEGVRSFFSAKCKVEAKVGGAFEMYFMDEAPEGSRGSENCTFLALESEKMLSFTWNAPPHLPEVRKQFTCVVLRFEAQGEKTKLSLRHYGWGESEEWTQAYSYFDAAWPRVLESLQKKYKGSKGDNST